MDESIDNNQSANNLANNNVVPNVAPVANNVTPAPPVVDSVAPQIPVASAPIVDNVVPQAPIVTSMPDAGNVAPVQPLIDNSSVYPVSSNLGENLPAQTPTPEEPALTFDDPNFNIGENQNTVDTPPAETGFFGRRKLLKIALVIIFVIALAADGYLAFIVSSKNKTLKSQQATIETKNSDSKKLQEIISTNSNCPVAEAVTAVAETPAPATPTVTTPATTTKKTTTTSTKETVIAPPAPPS